MAEQQVSHDDPIYVNNAIESLTGIDTTLWDSPTMAGLGLLLGGLGGFLLGRYLNEVKPKADLTKTLLQLRQRYDQLVVAGQFSRGPQYPRPQSMADAQNQAAQQLAEDEAVLRKSLRGRHTLYFIPFQWIAGVIGALGLVCIVMGFMI